MSINMDSGMPAGADNDNAGCCTCRRCRSCCGGRCACFFHPRAKLVYAMLLLVVAVILVSLAIWMPSYVENVLSGEIDKQKRLTPAAHRHHRKGWNQFADNSASNSKAVPLWYKVTMFNVTNPGEIVEKGAKPRVEEVGPYVYRENKVRQNFSWSIDDDGFQTLTYNTWRYFTYDAKRSGKGLDPHSDLVVSMNMPFQGAKVALLGQNTSDANLLMNALFGGAGKTDTTRMFLFDKTVHEILWGWEIAPGQSYDGALGPNRTSRVEAYADGLERITTGGGPGQEAQLRNYQMWNNVEYLVGFDGAPLWGTEAANRIRGTDATNYPKDLKEGQPLPTFVDQVQRELSLNYERKVKYRDITLFRYGLSPRELASQTEVPENAAYYLEYTGLLDGSRFKRGVPVTFCKAHMLDVDPKVRANVEGLNPQRKLHDTYIDVEPITGVTMHAAKRLQGNVHLTGPIKFSFDFFGTKQHVSWFPNTKPTADDGTPVVVPLFWVEEGGGITASKADDFRSQVYLAQFIINGFPYLAYFLALTALVVAVVLVVHLHRNATYSRGMYARVGMQVENVAVNAHLLDDQDSLYEGPILD